MATNKSEAQIELSIVIVNYNVKHFLGLCLESVVAASQDISTEIYVVDNASKDGSYEYLNQKFSGVKWILNKENMGFAKANNQALRKAKGEFVLLLNPDTIVAEDTFAKCLQYMRAHPKAGAIGVRMYDGSGSFLKESKRGLPSPRVAFFKMVGLSTIFHRSEYFNYYHLGYLNERDSHKVDVLAGAFMFMRNNVITSVNYLDEDYFMYGEDIDLSYKIQKAGYDNYYVSDTSIIHFKGESTKKGSLNYVKMFFGAMNLFYQKHFQVSKGLLGLMIPIAIFLSAIIASSKRILSQVLQPILDTILLALALHGLAIWWSHFHFRNPDHFQDSFWYFSIPLYCFIWILFIFLSGGYDRYTSSMKVFRGILIGSIAIVVVYAFLDESLRSSRIIIVLASLMGLITLPLSRVILSRGLSTKSTHSKSRNYLILGDQVGRLRAKGLLRENGIPTSKIISTFTMKMDNLGFDTEVRNWVASLNISDIVICFKESGYNRAIEFTKEFGNKVRIGFLPNNLEVILQSNTKDQRGYTLHEDLEYNITWFENKRKKRIFDIVLCMLIILLTPLILVFKNGKKGILNSIPKVLIGTNTWITYEDLGISEALPSIKPGKLFPMLCSTHGSSTQLLKLIAFNYAREYSIYKDWATILRFFQNN